MALYTALEDPKDDPVKQEHITPALSAERHGGVDRVKQKSWHGTLYGFRPMLFYVTTILAFLVMLNIWWCRDGYMGFERIFPLVAVQPSHLLPGAGWLLASRIVCLLASGVPLIFAVRAYRNRRLENGESLVLGGFEILLIFCTLWTWCCMAGYFLFSSVASFLYVAYRLVPALAIADMLWVWFDIAFGMSWLVFWACWIFLIPAAWLANRKDIVSELLSPKVLYLHNVNVVLVMVELLFSSWTINLTHCIFPIYFAIVYVFFNWWLYSKINRWIYFFLDYDRPTSVLFCLALVAFIISSFWSGSQLALGFGKS